jgi:N-acetylmuramoyl-L-alanine amidase
MLRTFTSFLSFVLVFTLLTSPVAAATKDGFAKGASAKELRKEYQDGKIKILIAAGHEPGYGGAVYQGVYEREITVDLADELERLLEQNPKYEVIVTRDDNAWDKELQKYFKKNGKKVQKFVAAQKKKMEKLLKKGKVEESADSHGVAAPNDVALRLYGINKWANENDVDLVVNLHVNDAPDHGPNAPSQHSGYAIYVPDSVYGNSKTSSELGKTIAKRLSALSDKSTNPVESAGVVPDREFIAVGAFGTLNVPSVLIEYGYITEPRFADVQYRDTLTKDLAYQTYLAIQDFFNDPVKNPRKVKKLPTSWPMPVFVPPVTVTTVTTTVPATTTTTVQVSSPVAPVVPVAPVSPEPLIGPITSTPNLPPAPIANMCSAFTTTLSLMADRATPNEDVKRLQQILSKDKTIYPEGAVTGFFGPATERAVKAFQKREHIASAGTPETTGYGAVGPRTSQALVTLCTK